jgi:hypothetical protein
MRWARGPPGAGVAGVGGGKKAERDAAGACAPWAAGGGDAGVGGRAALEEVDGAGGDEDDEVAEEEGPAVGGGRGGNMVPSGGSPRGGFPAFPMPVSRVPRRAAHTDTARITGAGCHPHCSQKRSRT